MTKKLLKAIIFVVLAGFVFLAGETFAAGGGTVTGTDNNGNTVHVHYDNTQTEGLENKGCTPLSAKLEKSRKCFFCPLFKILFTASASVSVASFDTLAGPFKMLLAIGMALYIAFLTLRQVSSFTKQDASKYISELLTMGFKVLVVWLLLSNGSQIYKLALEPILSAGLEAGASFLSSSSTDNAGLSSCASGSFSGTNRAFYSDALEQKIDCFLKKVAEETAVAHTIGSALWCASTEHRGFPKFSTAAAGGLIIVLAWLISIAFAFYLIDSIIRLGMIGAILPFLLAAWPFKVTSGYTAKGWSMFLNAFFVFVFLGLIISVVVQLLASAATGGEGNISTIQSFIDGDDINGLADTMKVGASGFLFLALCGLFGFKLCKESAALAAEMGTSGGTPIGSKIGGLAMNAAQTGGKKALHGAAGAGRLAAHVVPMPFAKGESVASYSHKLGDKVSGTLHSLTKKATSFLTPEGRIGNRTNNGTDSKTSSLNDNQTPTSPIGGRRENNNPLPNSDNNNNDGNVIPDTNSGGEEGTGPANRNNLNSNNNSGSSNNAYGYDSVPLDNGENGGAIPMGPGSGANGGQATDEKTEAPVTTSRNSNSDNPAIAAEKEKAENASENRESSDRGAVNSQAEKQNIDEIARRAAEAAAARVMGQNQQPSNETPLQNTTMKEGKVYTQNGKLQSETTRGADGNLVKTNYDKDGNISSIISEDKNGNREWSRYDTQGNVVESGNMKMATENGKSYVASQQIVKNGVSTTQNFYANGKILSESVQSVGKDGKPADLISFRQYNEQGQLIASENGKTKAQQAKTTQTAATEEPKGTQAAEKQQTAQSQQPTQPTQQASQATKEKQGNKANTPQTIYTYHSNGKRKSRETYKKDGSFSQEYFDKNGKIQSMRAFLAGNFNSEIVQQYKDGNLETVKSIDFGNGNIRHAKATYINGHYAGMQETMNRSMTKDEIKEEWNKIISTQQHYNTLQESNQMPRGITAGKPVEQTMQNTQNGTQPQQSAQPMQPNTQPKEQEQPKQQEGKPSQSQPKQAQAEKPDALATIFNAKTNENKEQTGQSSRPFERMQEGIIRDEVGRMRSETVKHDNGKSTRVLYDENGKIYDVAEEDVKGNRQWQSFDDNGRPTEHGNRTINDDGSVSYKVYDNYDRIISETVENTDGSVSQTMYKGNGEAYLRIDQDKDGNISYNGISAQQAPKDESLKPEESSDMSQPRKIDAIDILKDTLFKDDQKDKAPSSGKKDDADMERIKLRLKELEAIAIDLQKAAKGVKNLGGGSSSLSSQSVSALKQELQRRGVKI